ncbi:dynein axonemal heavy chain 1-like, partial [Schistocerca serialis cubense]|uniref:dynein axonemal heavy chain 1-like n=1 Tax=Schistocerca serialis cubense TaxID=2023355 RepID=UPI00214F2ECF
MSYTNQKNLYAAAYTSEEEDEEELPAIKRRHKCPQSTKLAEKMRKQPSVYMRKIPPIARETYVAAARQWTTYLEGRDIAFPIKSFKPKVQVGYTFRQQREYASLKISELLEEMDISNEKLIPPHVMEHYTSYKRRFGLYSTVNYLPLEIFDDEDFDCRTPDEWINVGIVDDVRHPVPAEAFIPLTGGTDGSIPTGPDNDITSLYDWVRVAVTDYDKEAKLYTVLSTSDGTDRIFHLPRIYVMFKAEDPINFADRIADAVQRRDEAENNIKYQFYVDCMMLPGIPDLNEASLNKLLKMASGLKFSPPRDSLDRLELEIRNDYKRTMCELSFRRTIQLYPTTYAYVRPPEQQQYTVPVKGCIGTGMNDFIGKKSNLPQLTIYAIPESYHAMLHIVEECDKVANMNLFTSAFGKFVPLEEFESTQTHTTENVIKFLQSSWLETITTNIVMCLRDVGKGWFDIFVDKWHVYEVSKLSRMMELAKLRMQSALRQLIEASLQMLTNLIETPCLCTMDCDETFTWGDDVVNTQFKPLGMPIFVLYLNVDENGVFYNTNPLNFEEVIMQLLNSAVRLTHTIKQVHPMVLQNLKFPEDLLLSSVGLMDPYVCKMRERIRSCIQHSIIPLIAYSKEYYKHMDLWKLNVDEYISEYESEKHEADEIKDQISLLAKLKKHLELTLPERIWIGPFIVIIDPLKKFLVNKRQDLYAKMLESFATRQREAIEDILDEFKQIFRKLLEKPNSIEHLFEIKEWMETVPVTVKNLEEATRKIVIEYDIFDHFWYSLSQEDFESKWEAVGWPLRVYEQIDETNLFHEEEIERLHKIQIEDEFALYARLEQITVQVSQMARETDIAKAHELAVEVRRMWKAMKETQEHGQLLNQRQRLFGDPITPFDALVRLIKESEPYRNMWLATSDWLRWYDIWMDNPLINIDGEMIDKMVSEIYKTMQKSIKVFADIPGVQAIAMQVRDQMEEFKPLIPILQGLRNPGMKQRHWNQLIAETGIELEYTPNLTFNQCLDLGLADHVEVMTQISETAAKEYAIELTLNKMKGDWAHIDMEVTPYKATGTYIMKIADEITQMLDDHIALTQQVSYSPYRPAFEEEITDWEEKLHLTQDVLDEWVECQKEWMYLEPIFTSEDINRQLPVESKKYNTMDRNWKRIMKGAFDNPKIMEYCPDKKLLTSLRECNYLLEQVQKGLSDYLETKRSVFPRFYFLSDDELLEILAQARNPTAVQPHLRKCFENIAKLKFEDDLRITTMFSAEGESVELNPFMYPVGNVEDWLLKVEEIMKNTVRLTLGASLKEINEKDRNQWVLEWPGQVVIAGSQTHWTEGVEKSVLKNCLEDYYGSMLKQLDGLRQLVKGPLKRIERQVLSALIVIEVHARDVTSTLVLQNISNINDFDWISQLRYYWVDDSQLKVRAVNAEFQYGYEYLGNSGRLVITPLTDRCYLTLTGALHLKFGGAPAGPAGTGKTETTKDLAKAFAIQCVVFNCSDQLDYMAMGKFFKGLASSGAWACFDEFNRIDIEVLSVIAQQITTIQKAQQARQDRFLFEGVEIALKQSCAVFITMNPGYAGRTELPDNLKALFRPVAMMVPNYALIAEISLFSFGFSDAKELARKITTTFKLSSEQLSTQDHYDFGMRAVKTVIAVAGNLKREMPDMDERQIVLRSLRDVNVPKFLRDDLKLFNGIVSDLFPRMVEQAIDYGEMEKAICKSCLVLQMEVVPEFVKKCIQLYETTVVRHGLMLVGPAGGGKTKCYEVLAHALTSLKGKPSPSGLPFEKVHTYVLNPKSITLGQLYGEFDALTHEWTDGILASLVRGGASAEDDDKRWYVFDGPVDAVWIENMNTVLDDNKKLCLTSGEIIKLQESQTMMFEVADLAVASPATVSRCGMVYLDSGVLGLQPLIDCWLRRGLPQLAVQYREQLRELTDNYLFPALTFLRSGLTEIVATQDNALVFSYIRMVNHRLRPLANPEGKPPPAQPFLDLMPVLLVPWILFSIVWSVGATCDGASRTKFSDWLRRHIRHHGHVPAFPHEGLVYDYKLHDGGFTDTTPDGEPSVPMWQHWLSGVEEYIIGPETKFEDIEVPTIDNVRSSALLAILVTCEHQVLCVGPTGTGKSVTVASTLSRGLHRRFLCEFLAFSARTSANQTQDLIDSKLDRRRKGVFGPPLLKRLVFFIDDLNMPALETFGAQPPIELLRQWMDFGGWYDIRNIGEFRTLVDVIFVGAMGPPGGGRNPVTARLLRHFHFLSFPELENTSKVRMFGTIVSSWLGRCSTVDKSMETAVVSATMAVYSAIESEMRPTPDRTHYTFNLRDLARVFQGLLMHVPGEIKDAHHMLRLWYHECCRVFQDRLVNDQDRNWFDQLLNQHIEADFEADPDEVLGDRNILFGDFMDQMADVRLYVEITDMTKLSRVLEEALADYNYSSTAPMRLVLFTDAVRHTCRLARILRLPRGHALLLGVAGSGRRSLARLATHVAGLAGSELQMSRTYGLSDWRDDVKSMLLNSGVQGRQSAFVFSDTQIKLESFLEDVNSILNSGDVPNLYAADDLERINQKMRGFVTEMGLPPTPANLFSAYVKQVRANFHCLLTMSPIGEVFRARLRQFPALVNCCTIDWFSAWPESALQSVAMRFMDEMPELDVTEEILNGIVITCQYMHQSSADASEQYLQELSRHNYVTPTNYLELLSSFQRLYGTKRGELANGIKRLQTGLDKLLSTAEEVKQLQIELTAMRPALEVAAKEAAKMLEKIAEDTAVAEETKIVVQKEEQAAAVKAEETQAIADDAQRDLDEAMPLLNAAEASLRALNKGDITEVRALKKPPAGVHLVMETICIVKDVKPNKIPGKGIGEKILDYWEPGRGLLANPDHFLNSLMNFDKESITEEIINKLESYVVNPLFQPEKIITVSKACTSLCMWVHAMYKYYFVNKAVAPKKAALAKAKAELEATERALAAAKAKMKAVLDGLKLLQDTLEKTEAHKADLEAKMKLCEERMGRAVRLISGLADERERWGISVKTLSESVINVVGDVLLSAGAVAYLTPFTDSYRRNLISKWITLVSERAIPHTDNVSPVSTMGDPVLIRTWQIFGLPRDTLSAENAVLAFNSRRWPLFIDPQGQANRWVRNMGKESGMSIVRLSDSDLLRTLESAIRLGKPCLIENVGAEIDSALDPVLLRQVFQQRGTDMLKLGDSVIPYNHDFRLYITTKLPNPHYTPELTGKVMLVNFTLVPSGLQDQLLALVVMQERPDLEEARSSLIVSSAQMKNELKEIEDRILHRLSVSEGSPVDDIDLIVTLEASKVKSEEIKQKVKSAEETQINIDNTRALYIPVANRAQILFFCVSDLGNIDPMYQYSLEWFISIFIGSMTNTEASADINERVENINNYFTFSLYSNVCRSLFEKHKMHFAFLLCVRILMDEERIDPTEWQFLLAGGNPLQEVENPAPEWLSSKSWKEIMSLEALPKFKPFVDSFVSQLAGYKKIFDSLEPHKEPLPDPWESELDEFQHLLILKALRPDKVTNSMQIYLSHNLGQQFVEPQTTELSAMYKESGPAVPLIFVLSTGTDPAADLYKFADKMKMGKRMFVISLGQGQGPRAESMLLNALEIGNWVFFQNCHLAPSWMPRLERLIENISPESSHKEFRVWLTSTPSPSFPVSILQNGTKMTVEPPRGVKANMIRAYSNQVTEMAGYISSDGVKVPIFKWLLFSLCLFHGVCLERRKFGPLGFNIPYEFTDGDLRICISQLHMFLEEYEDIPFKVLMYTAGHINYGGRVTDDWDRRCIMNVLADYYRIEVCDENHQFEETGIYHQLPADALLADYVDYIRTLPLNDDPALFGLHANADISYAQSETYSCLATLLALQPRVVGGEAQSQEEVTSSSARAVLQQVPHPFNLSHVSEKYPVLYEESLNTVLVQEVIRFNRLLKVIHSSLQELLRALKGLVVMSEALENMAYSLYTNIVPSMWSSKAYPSLKPLGAWVQDLIARIKFLQDWIDSGIPACFWISGFFFPQAFLTATLQNYARKYVVSIDSIGFGFKIKERQTY